MSKLFKTVKRTFRVTVIPDVNFRDYHWEKQVERLCENMTPQIHRHIDGVANAYMEYDKCDICVFCKTDFEVSDVDCPEEGVLLGQPVCCNEAAVAWRAQQ